MKMVRKLPLLLLVAAPFFAPVQTRAGVIGDLLNSLLGNNKDKTKDKDKTSKKDKPAPASSTNSVPLDGGVVFLVLAGVGLGAKLIYDARAKQDVAGDI